MADLTLVVNKEYIFKFTGSGGDDRKVVDVFWDFGDNDIAHGFEVPKIYFQTGIYTLRVTATNDCGAKATGEYTVEVVSEEITDYTMAVIAGGTFLGFMGLIGYASMFAPPVIKR